MNRTTLSLLAAATALAAVTGFAVLTAPEGATTTTGAKPSARLPVERSGLLCPSPSNSEVAETVYTSFTPVGGDGGEAGRAELKPAATTAGPGGAGEKTDTETDEKADTETDEEKDGKADEGKTGTEKDGKRTAPAAGKPVVTLAQPGKPASAEADGGKAPALIGTAVGRLAPGWTTQQTTTVPAGGARGLLGLSCVAPGTDFWFPGASTAGGRQDYVHLINPDDTAVVADIELYGPEGPLGTQLTEGVLVPAGAEVPVLLPTLTSGPAAADVTVHVSTRSGRIGAVVRSADEKLGSDWLTASADPSGTLVLPGIPADATAVHLVAYAPGEDDAVLKIRLAGASGTITPAGAETLHVKSGMTAALDLKDVTRGEAGALLLSPARAGKATPVVAALRVVRGTGDKQEVAFVPASGPVGERASAAGNRAGGTTLTLTAPEETAQVRVVTSEGTEAGTRSEKTYTVKGGTTLSVPAAAPAGLKGTYALTVETVSGGPVYAARALAEPQGGIPMFTVQTLTYDRGTVRIPAVAQDLSVLDD